MISSNYILCDNYINHALLIEKDLILIVMNKIKVNWINVIKEHISKTKKKPKYRIPYVVLISNFIEHFEVDVEGEVTRL